MKTQYFLNGREITESECPINLNFDHPLNKGLVGVSSGHIGIRVVQCDDRREVHAITFDGESWPYPATAKLKPEGHWSFDGSRPWVNIVDGSIGEVKHHDRVLTADEINKAYIEEKESWRDRPPLM